MMKMTPQQRKEAGRRYNIIATISVLADEIGMLRTGTFGDSTAYTLTGNARYAKMFADRVQNIKKLISTIPS